MTSTKSKTIKTFYCSFGNFGYVGQAESLAAFCRLTGLGSSDRAYISETGNAEDIEIAERAGPDHYMYHSRGVWEKCISKEKLAERTKIEAIEMAEGGGNKPSISIMKGGSIKQGFSSTIERSVIIDGEERGQWARIGSFYYLQDITGFDLYHTCVWHEKHGGGLGDARSKNKMRVSIRVWNEYVALANSVECWEAGLLPSVAEQKIAAMRRKEAAEKSKSDDAALTRLRPYLNDLVKYLEKQDDTTASEFLKILNPNIKINQQPE